MINLIKLKTIVFSRAQKKPNAGSFVEKRREICKTCPLNTKNLEKVSLKISIIKLFSDLYSYLTGNKKVDVLGSCSVCGCSIFYMTQQKEESCSTTPMKWKKVPLPRKSKK